MTPSSFGVRLITHERERQVDDEGWSETHDDEHSAGELAAAASCYAAHAIKRPDFADIGAYRAAPPPPLWPWDVKWWKPKNPTRDLARAGALCAAEIDRIERNRSFPPEGGE